MLGILCATLHSHYVSSHNLAYHPNHENDMAKAKTAQSLGDLVFEQASRCHRTGSLCDKTHNDGYGDASHGNCLNLAKFILTGNLQTMDVATNGQPFMLHLTGGIAHNPTAVR